MFKIRKINPNSTEEIELVATRMRSTLIEVLGETKGTEIYSTAWLKDRVLWHLDPNRDAKIFLAEANDKTIIGHAIARSEDDKDKIRFGYFSTIYVVPNSRNLGVAKALITAVIKWCRGQELPYITYNTAENNDKLINLFKKFSFEIIEAKSEMVQLKMELK